MAVRYISKGKGKNRKSFPIRPKKGVSIRSVSLKPSAILKVNKEQGKFLNKGESANFSKALNSVIMRAKRVGIPVYDTNVNDKSRKKQAFHMWIVKHPEKGDRIKGSDTVVMAENYGQATDDMITVWNKEDRMNKTIGYPQVQGTAINPIENNDDFITNETLTKKQRLSIERKARCPSCEEDTFEKSAFGKHSFCETCGYDSRD